MMIGAFTLSTLSLVITPPSAAGISMSTSSASSSSFVICSRLGEAVERAIVLVGVANRREDVEALGPVVAAAHVADGDDLALGLAEELGRVRADVAEALDRDAASPCGLRPQPAERLEREDADAAAGRLLAAGDAVQLDRLAGDHAGVEAVVLAVLVHDPGHHLGVGAHVGGGDVDVGADEVVDLVDELAGEPLQLAAAEADGG